MKDHVDKSRGIVTLITEALTNLNQTHRALKVSQSYSAQKAKTVRFFGQVSGQITSLTTSTEKANTQSHLTTNSQESFLPRHFTMISV
jgi:hypothetical protein